MKIALISYHYRQSGHTRPSTLERAFRRLHIDYRVIHADFEHISKTRQNFPEQAQFLSVPVPGYTKNISLRRIFSHLVFMWRLLWRLDEITEDTVYLCVPPTSSLLLVPALNSRGKRVIVDFVDLWPDALPVGGLVRTFLDFTLFSAWRALRDGLARQADMVVACNAYFLRQAHLIAVKQRPLYLTNDDAELQGIHQQTKIPLAQELRFAFLGSLNNVTDTRSLVGLLQQLARTRSVRLVLLGGGEGMPQLRAQLTQSQIAFEEIGMSFDPAVKRRVLSDCHFGYNGYKGDSEVALSYKSIDYLAAGLPIINNAKGDLWELIAERKAGINFHSAELGACSLELLALSDAHYAELRTSARALYESEFTEEIFTQRLSAILHEARK